MTDTPNFSLKMGVMSPSFAEQAKEQGWYELLSPEDWDEAYAAFKAIKKAVLQGWVTDGTERTVSRQVYDRLFKKLDKARLKKFKADAKAAAKAAKK